MHSQINLSEEDILGYLDDFKLPYNEDNIKLICHNLLYLKNRNFLAQEQERLACLQRIKYSFPEKKTLCKRRPYLTPLVVPYPSQSLLELNYDMVGTSKETLLPLIESIFIYKEGANYRRFIKKVLGKKTITVVRSVMGGVNFFEDKNEPQLVSYENHLWLTGYGVAWPVSLVLLCRISYSNDYMFLIKNNSTWTFTNVGLAHMVNSLRGFHNLAKPLI